MTGPEIQVTFRKRYRTLFAMGSYTLLMGYQSIFARMDSPAIGITTAFMGLLFLFELGLLLYQWSVKPKMIRLLPGELRVGDRVFRPDDMKSIIIEEYYGPHIGIKSKKKLLVPIMLAFRVLNKKQADDAFEEIHEWGEQNNVPVLTQRMWMP